MPCGIRPGVRRDGAHSLRWLKARRGPRSLGAKWRAALDLRSTAGEDGCRLGASSESDGSTPDASCIAPSMHGFQPSLAQTVEPAIGSTVEPLGQVSKEPQVLAQAPERPWAPPACEQLLGPNGSGPELVAALAAIYESLTALAPTPQKVTCFHAVRRPGLGVEAYLGRLRTYCQCSSSCFIVSLVYIDRIVKAHPDFEVGSLNIHRLLASTVVLAAKFMDDIYYSNAYYAKVCGLSVKELNSLEVALVKMVNWKLDVSPEEFEEYCKHILSAMRGESARWSAGQVCA